MPESSWRKTGSWVPFAAWLKLVKPLASRSKPQCTLSRQREARLAGRPMSAIVDELIAGGGRDLRLGAAAAFRQFEREIQSMRVGVIRAMVDEEGLSLTDASARLGVSRQAGARLYRLGGDQPTIGGSEDVTKGPTGTP